MTKNDEIMSLHAKNIDKKFWDWYIENTEHIGIWKAGFFMKCGMQLNEKESV